MWFGAAGRRHAGRADHGSPDFLAAGATATVTVAARFTKGTPAGNKQAWLVLSEGGAMVAHAAVYAYVK